MTAPGIEVRNLSLHFGDRRLFDNLSLTVPGGQWVSLLGASGAGKTSLLRVMAGGPRHLRGSGRQRRQADTRPPGVDGAESLLYPG